MCINNRLQFFEKFDIFFFAMLLIDWRETVVRCTECIGTIFHLGHINNLMGYGV